MYTTRKEIIHNIPPPSTSDMTIFFHNAHHIPSLGSERISSIFIKFHQIPWNFHQILITFWITSTIAHHIIRSPTQNLYKLDTKTTHPRTGRDTHTPSSLPPNVKSKQELLPIIPLLSSPLCLGRLIANGCQKLCSMLHGGGRLCLG